MEGAHELPLTARTVHRDHAGSNDRWPLPRNLSITREKGEKTMINLYEQRRLSRCGAAGMIGRKWFVAALVLVGLGVPPMLHAQQAVPTSASAVSVDPKVRNLAMAQMEIDATRNEYFAKLSAIHEGPPKDLAREEFTKAIEVVCEKYGMTTEQFEQAIFLVSSDDSALAAFNEALEVIANEMGTVIR